jgi:hypothetical protein
MANGNGSIKMELWVRNLQAEFWLKIGSGTHTWEYNMITLNGREVIGIEIDGVDMRDYPDFCDAFFNFAYYADDETELTETELDKLRDENPELVYEMIMNR